MIMRSLISLLCFAILVCISSAAGAVPLRPAHHYSPTRSQHVSTHQRESRPANEFQLDASKLAASIQSVIDNLLVRLGLRQSEIPPPPVEKPSIRSKVGTTLSVIGAIVAIEAVIELAGGNGDLFLQLDAASLVIAVLARLLSSGDISCLCNRGVITLGILLGSMHLLTV